MRDNPLRRFQFRLALGLGKTLAELEPIPHDELVGWQAFYHLEPWGCEPADHRTELQLNLLYAINSKPNATIPRFIDRDPQAHVKADPTPEELAEKVRDFFLGKTVKATADVPSDKATNGR